MPTPEPITNIGSYIKEHMDTKASDEAARKEKEIEKAKLNQEIAKIIAASEPPTTDKNYMDLEIGKALMEKVTLKKNLRSTTNITRQERWEIIKLILASHYSGNPVPLVIADAHMELNRSLTGNNPISVLEIFGGMFRAVSTLQDEVTGRWGRFKQFVGGH